MAPRDPSPDWLGDLRWQGFPRLDPIQDLASAVTPEESVPRPAAPHRPPIGRIEDLARENEALRAKIEALTRLAYDFERRLQEAAAAYEGAALQSDSRRRAGELESERLSGELEAAKSELSRAAAREATRDAELRLERERRSDAEKTLLEVRDRLRQLEESTLKARAHASELEGSAVELRRQADAQNERLLKAKALTDQDVALLRQEMREFLAKFNRLKESFGETP